jgi:hypothetical protein
VNFIGLPRQMGQRDWIQWNDMETWEDIFSEHAKGKDIAQIVHELEQAVTSFKEALAQLPDEQFLDAEALDKMAEAIGLHHMRKHAVLIAAWSKQHPKSRRPTLGRLLTGPSSDATVIRPLLGIIGFLGIVDSLWLVVGRKDWSRFWTTFVQGAGKQPSRALGLAALELGISLLFIRHALRRKSR